MTIPFPPSKILVPIDGTDASFSAWLHARDLSKRFGSQVEGLYVQDWPVEGLEYVTPNLDEELRKAAFRRIRDRIGDAAKLFASSGEPMAAILHRASSGGFDLIVMGTHGRTGLARLILGSVAEEVVRRATIPVLIVKSNPKPIRSVLAPVYEAFHVEGAAAMAASVAVVSKAKLNFLTVVERRDDAPRARLRLKERIGDLPIPVQRICRPAGLVAVGKPADKIIEASPKHGLLVLAAHRKSVLEDLVLGTTAERCLRYAVGPVLAVPTTIHARAKSKESEFAPALRLAAAGA